YVVEAVSKYSYYPYGRQVFYIDAETHYIVGKEAYDRQGRLWKTMLFVLNQRGGLPLEYPFALVFDHKIEHATVFYYYHWRHNDPAMTPANFSLSALERKGGRD